MSNQNLDRRNFLKRTAAAGAGLMAFPAASAIGAKVAGANERINVAVIGLGNQGSGHLGRIMKVPGTKIVAVCDADTRRMDKAKSRCEGAVGVQDLRKILDMKDVDAIVTATPNHWHAPLTVMACQAGKHVYVEKPVSHSIWEGRKMIEAARKYDRIVQGGTQQRSCKAPQAAGADIRAGKYGKVKAVHCMQYNVREPIGLVTSPQPVDAEIDYNLWAGPAPMTPVMRKKFHYDWHWQWNWGDGEMGNWLVHYTDDLCHLLGWDEVPTSVISAGGRFLWKDNGETPNMLFSLMEHKGMPVVFEIRDLPAVAGSKGKPTFLGARGGNVIFCENAIVKIARGGGNAYELDGKTRIRKYPGDGGGAHMGNFFKAIRSGKRDDLNAEIAGGVVSAAICHLANASYRLGKNASIDAVREGMKSHEDALNTIESVVKQIGDNKGDLKPMMLGPKLTFDPAAGRFTGGHAAEANKFLHYKMRDEFAIEA